MHKTRFVFVGCNVVSDGDLRDAVTTLTATTETMEVATSQTGGPEGPPECHRLWS